MNRFGGATRFDRRASRQMLGVVALGAAGLFCLCGAVVLMVFGESSSRSQGAVVEPPVEDSAALKASILTPLREIPAGTPLRPSMFKMVDKPAAAVEKGMLKSFEEVTGQYAGFTLQPGLPVYEAHITSSTRTILEAVLPDGYRAMTIRVNRESVIEGWLQPGNRVDVFWTTEVGGELTTHDLVPCIPVLSVGQSTQVKTAPDGPVADSITLQVTREQGAAIQLASSSGKLSVMLCGRRESTKSEPPVIIDRRALIGQKPAAVVRQCSGHLIIDGQRWCVALDGSLVLEKA